MRKYKNKLYYKGVFLMSKEMIVLKFYFRNGEIWMINCCYIGDFWIK